MFNKNETPKKNITTSNQSQLDTMIGKNTKLNGDVNFSGILNLDGTVTGSLIGTKNEDVLIITETGRVEGKIEVANIMINGTIVGDIYSNGKIEILAKANIDGNIHYHNIEMETGSKINGQLIYKEGKGNNISKIEDKKAK